MPLNNIKIEANKSLSRLTTLRIGGPAEWLAEPRNINELENLLSWSHQKNIECKAIGAGSNLLISDSGIEGLSICMRKFHGFDINSLTGEIKVLGGESLPCLARKAANSGLKGLEWSIGIPGTIGGAVVMNAGAQGSCISKILKSVQVISMKDGEKFDLDNKDLQFSYRNSLLQKENLIVISALLKLEPGHDHEKINRITKLNLHKRTNTQPYHLPSCGSVFRNPKPLKAGTLIDNLGLKGTRVGGAEISKIHANFIVNRSQASASDVNKLIVLIQKKVKDAYGVLLHPEVKQLGF